MILFFVWVSNSSGLTKPPDVLLNLVCRDLAVGQIPQSEMSFDLPHRAEIWQRLQPRGEHELIDIASLCHPILLVVLPSLSVVDRLVGSADLPAGFSRAPRCVESDCTAESNIAADAILGRNGDDRRISQCAVMR